MQNFHKYRLVKNCVVQPVVPVPWQTRQDRDPLADRAPAESPPAPPSGRHCRQPEYIVFVISAQPIVHGDVTLILYR